MKDKYDVIIIGSGPAGIGAAYELTKNGKSVLMIEKGKSIQDRRCPIIEGKVEKCCNCKVCSITSGAGGSGTFSDFKMNLNTEFGGNLLNYISKDELQKNIDYVYENLYKQTYKYNYKGNVTHVSDLPTIDNKINDIWYIKETEERFCWDGKSWLQLSDNYFQQLQNEIYDDYFDIYWDGEKWLEKINDKINNTKTNYKYNKLKSDCIKHNIDLLEANIVHIGSDKAPMVIDNIINKLKETGNFDIVYNTNVRNEEIEEIYLQGKRLHYCLNTHINNSMTMTYVTCKDLIIATGRSGSDFCYQIAKKFNIPTAPSTVDIGVRVETKAEICKEFTDTVYDFKAVYHTPTFNDKVRSFCVNPNGFVSTESNNGILNVNGYSNKDIKSDNTNFSVLVSVNFTEPFNDPNEYAQYIAKLGNMLSGGIMVQTLGDLKKGRRSNVKRLNESIVKPTLNAEPGDLSFVLPYRFLTDIKEYLSALDKVMPGIDNDSTLLYGIEAKYYSRRILVDKTMKNNTVNNHLYFVGDGAGISRGIIQATVSGVLAAKDICDDH